MRWLAVAASVLLLIVGLVPGALAQDPLPPQGLERAVARTWSMPIFITERATITEYNELGTPLSEITSSRVTNLDGTPIATPEIASETASGLVFLVVAVFEFDTAANATAAWPGFVSVLEETAAGTAEFAGKPVAAIDAGDESAAVFATGEWEGVPLTFAFAVVRDDRYIYQVQGQFARLAAEDETIAIVNALAGAPASDGTSEFDPNGGSTGGLWDKLANLAPAALSGTTATDVEIYPVPSAGLEPVDATPAG